MVQLGGGLGLGQEADGGPDPGQDYLQGAEAVEADLPGAIDDAEPPRPSSHRIS
jgi:hypothetical protein